MSSKPRKSDSSSGNTKKLQNARSYSTNSNTADFHPFSRRVKDMLKCVPDRTSNPCTVLNPQLLLDPATTTQSPGPLVGPAVIPKVEIQWRAGDTAMQIVVKEGEEDMVVAGLIPHKDAGGHRMVLVVVPVVGPEEGLVGTELVLRIIHKGVVSMGVQVQVVGTGINHTGGSNDGIYTRVFLFFSLTMRLMEQ